MGTRVGRSAAGTLAAALGCVSGVTFAASARALRPGTFASTPEDFVHGRLWLLLSSALVADKPVPLSLVSFAALGVAVLVVCGPRLLWTTALVGHVASAALVYLAIAAVRSVDPSAFRDLMSLPDYGLSAAIAAWIGALAATAWRARPTRTARAWTLAACVASALLG